MTKDSSISFYDRSEAERVAITVAAIEEGRTVMERWSVLGDTEANPWSARAALAAEWLVGEAAVVDLGCGTMNLERYLAPGQVYIPVDVVARDGRTLVCDFNREPPPKTQASAAVCLGLIEYILQPSAFMVELRRLYKSVVISYCTTDAPQAPPLRREHAWVNDFDTAGLEAMFREAGWSVEERRKVDDVQLLFRLAAL